MRQRTYALLAVLLVLAMAACGGREVAWTPREIRHDPEPVLHHFSSLPEPESMQWGSAGSAEENTSYLCFFAFYSNAQAMKRAAEDYGVLEASEAPVFRFVPEQLEGKELVWQRLSSEDAFQEGVPLDQRFAVEVYVCTEPPVIYLEGSLGG